MIPRTMSAMPSPARPEKRQRLVSEDGGAARTKVTRVPGATSVKPSALGASLSERECLNMSLTSLHWLCDLRLTGGIIPSGAHKADVPTAAPAAPAPIKPEHSYAELISLAMQHSPKKALTLNEIYNFVMDFFPYYRTVEPSWKNSIRYNLSQNKLFTRLPMDSADKAATWTLAARVQAPAAAAAAGKGKKGAGGRKQAQHQQSRLAICEAAGDDWEDIEDVTPLAAVLPDPAGSDDDWMDAFAADTTGTTMAAAAAAAAAASAITVVQHPWADEKRLSHAEPAPRVSAIADPSFAASLASCLSIFPLSASALAAESLSGSNWELALGAGAGDAGRLLPDDTMADASLGDGPIPRDWL